MIVDKIFQNYDKLTKICYFYKNYEIFGKTIKIKFLCSDKIQELTNPLSIERKE